MRAIDPCLVALAVAFPWSTTVTTCLVIVCVALMLVTYGSIELTAELQRPACALPLALVGLAVLGMSWADGVPWSDQLHAFGKVAKFICFLPFFVHFQHTLQLRSIFGAYVISNLVLLSLSFLVFFSPDVASLVGAKAPGVPLKNYLDQSQSFAFLGVVLLALAAESIRDHKLYRAIGFAVMGAAFLVNLAFVNVARSAFIYLPLMLAFLVYRYVRGRLFLSGLAVLCMLGLGAWAVSDNLQFKMTRLLSEVGAFKTNTMFPDGYEAGGAERLEFWRKSIGFVRSAPILGHGTGSTKVLFASEAAGQTGIRAKIVDNPHNQTLAVAIQWGVWGCIVLYAMWGAHVLLFRGVIGTDQDNLLAWIGLLAVGQNCLSSLMNSHLFDFYQGWLYLFAVAVAGGRIEAQQRQERSGSRPKPS